MSKTLNLQEISKKIANQHVQAVDSALAEYIRGTIALLEARGKDITEYALIQVDNPMQLDVSSVRISMQWRIVPIDSLSNVPTYREG